jgi:hypothetical protein
MKDWIIPLRSGGIVFLFMAGEELLRSRTWEHLWTGLPYIFALTIIMIAVEYARIYKVQLPEMPIPPTETQTKVFTPLVWG